MTDKNLGVLERWWAVEWSQVKAVWYCTLHWSCRVYLENNWVEDRGEKDLYGDPLYREVITMVGVVRGSFLTSDVELVKVYFGEPRLELGAYQARKM